jgi:predicted ATPase/DNA-binding CsgD family transcriptional regulator/tetratricopeptide (TPR) repeat protein
MAHGSSRNGGIQADQLTWREQEILVLLADRCTNREIGDQLHLAESTVKDYVSNILSKLYVKNRRQAVARAAELGLLEAQSSDKHAFRVNLPAEPTPFVGRRRELSQIQELQAQTRLLTLVGPGGIGKSRLAVKVARNASPDYADGVYFVPLAPISDPGRIVQRIAEVLKFPLMSQEDPLTQLLRYLQNKQLLLVLDNCEHLLDGVDIVSEMLPRAAEVKILATSRERLNLLSETVFTVSGIDFTLPERPPTSGINDASTLFILAANKVHPGYKPSPGEIKQIELICHAVIGMPLAIELAAAWLQILSLDEIALELEHGLDILSTDARDAPERHRSLRAVFNHSWNLLEVAEQNTLQYLSIFKGGFTRQAAQQVAGASLNQLVDLVNKSFLSHNPKSGRLEFHELLRQYAQEKLQANEQAYTSVQRAHALYFADFMLERWQYLKDRRQLETLAEIEADIENVRAAWSYWLDQKDASQLWKFSKTIWLAYWIRGWHLEGSQLFAEAVQVLGVGKSEIEQAMRALAMTCQGYFLTWLDISEEGYQIAKQSVELLQQLSFPEALAIALDSLAVNAYFHGCFSDWFTASDQLIAIARHVNDPWLISFALYAMSLAHIQKEEYALARQLAEEQLQLCEDSGDAISSTYPLITLGHCALANQENDLAREYYQRCTRISQQVGFHYALQTSSKYLGKVELLLGNLPAAERSLTRCLVMTNDIGFVRDVVNLYCEFGRLKMAQGQRQEAVEILAFVEQHPFSNNIRMLEGRIRDSARDLLEELEGDLPETTFQSALEAGRNLGLEQIYKSLVN